MISARAPPSTAAVSAASSSASSSRLSVFISRSRIMVTSAMSLSGQVSATALPAVALALSDADMIGSSSKSVSGVQDEAPGGSARLDPAVRLGGILQSADVFNHGYDLPPCHEIERVGELRARHALGAENGDIAQEQLRGIDR